MRDLFVTLVVFASVPLILGRPYVGILVWSWLAYMNPHRLAWGFATTMPFAQIVLSATVIGMALSREKYRFPWTRETIVLLMLVLWMCVTTYFALEPQQAPLQLEKVLKIQLGTALTLMIMCSRERIELLVWVIIASLGFYGVKGGIFTILTGGGYHILGPPGTFIGGNNEIGLAMVMTIPLMRYLQLQMRRQWARLAFTAAILLTIVAVLGTQSRGGFIGLTVMGMFLVWKSPHRVRLLIPLVIAAPLAFSFMPESWHERMASIENYEEDSSAQGRINAWGFAIDLASDRPLVGGGFETFQKRWFYVYAANPDSVADAHSIYFEVLGEHGYPGLALFLILFFFVWRSTSWIITQTKKDVELKWASDLARMLQVSLVGYAFTGAFLGLAYFDLYYALVAIAVNARAVVRQRVQNKIAETAERCNVKKDFASSTLRQAG
jgi:probable O-glycosylation ligase (exosortase A-associated)